MSEPRTKTPEVPAEVTAPQVRVRRRVTSEQMLELDPRTTRPGMVYRWVRNDPVRVNSMRLKGYDIVSQASGVRPTVGVLDDRADGTVAMGDLILMATDADLYQEGRREVQSTTEGRLRRTDKEFRDLAEKSRTQIITDKE